MLISVVSQSGRIVPPDFDLPDDDQWAVAKLEGECGVFYIAVDEAAKKRYAKGRAVFSREEFACIIEGFIRKATPYEERIMWLKILIEMKKQDPSATVAVFQERRPDPPKETPDERPRERRAGRRGRERVRVPDDPVLL